MDGSLKHLQGSEYVSCKLNNLVGRFERTMVQLSYIAVDQSFQCQKPVEQDSDNKYYRPYLVPERVDTLKKITISHTRTLYNETFTISL